VSQECFCTAKKKGNEGNEEVLNKAGAEEDPGQTVPSGLQEMK